MQTNFLANTLRHNRPLFRLIKRLLNGGTKILQKTMPGIYCRIAIMQNGFNETKIDKQICSFNGVGIDVSQSSPELIVSLTSFPPRMEKLHYTLFSLLNQTKKPHRIILWLGEEQFPNKEYDVPEKVLVLLKCGVSIEWCKDIRSYKKLVPAYRKYPDAVIVTADDDLYYAKNWLELLYNSYLTDTTVIHCIGGLRVRYTSEGIRPHSEWDFCPNLEPSYTTFGQGGRGVLYPPHSLYKDIDNVALFTRLVPTDDDMWFWAMAVLNGTKIKTVQSPLRNVLTNIKKELDPNYSDSLHYSNHYLGQTPIQLANIINQYPLLTKRILE
ncbi:MAG: glycosyl transferase [Termitinemataceae bacterium]|nr:MAG: glycosyl transferase [Termitinemataceae bacterium]